MKVTGKEAIIALLDGKVLCRENFYKLQDGILNASWEGKNWFKSVTSFNVFIDNEFEIIEEKDNKKLLQEAIDILTLNCPLVTCPNCENFTNSVGKLSRKMFSAIDILKQIEL